MLDAGPIGAASSLLAAVGWSADGGGLSSSGVLLKSPGVAASLLGPPSPRLMTSPRSVPPPAPATVISPSAINSVK